MRDHIGKKESSSKTIGVIVLAEFLEISKLVPNRLTDWLKCLELSKAQFSNLLICLKRENTKRE